MKANHEKCKAFQVFQHWQLNRLWPAIAEDRRYMGEKLRRAVGFEEAEKDFFDHNGYGCLENWRAEFCSRHCPHRNTCALAAGFIAMAANPRKFSNFSYAASRERAHVLNRDIPN